MISIVVETWNLRGELDPLRRLLHHLAPQRGHTELVITHSGMPSLLQRELAIDARWIELDRDAGYYDHKNRGFAASSGDIVAFIDGDCEPSPNWLAELTRPILSNARVVAGLTTYRGDLARLANELDFPVFKTGAYVRNFFANNVAFAREAFPDYPTLPMFHGQCQVLAMQLDTLGIAIHQALGAHVIHAWPANARAWLSVRLLRGADTASLLPHVIRHFAPRVARVTDHLGRLPAFALLAARAVTGTAAALRRGPVCADSHWSLA